tara:strand:- start:240 stop:1466 length:1227 start_codon:yes stop_codon:yes gene_type:complete
MNSDAKAQAKAQRKLYKKLRKQGLSTQEAMKQSTAEIPTSAPQLSQEMLSLMKASINTTNNTTPTTTTTNTNQTASQTTATNSNNIYCTLITSDDFLPGLQVMLHSLVKTKPIHNMLILLTPEVNETSRNKILSMNISSELNAHFQINILEVPAIPNPNSKVHVPGWVNAGYTKLHIFNLVQYHKVVYIDADTLVLRNIATLFDHPGLAAAPDVFPPDKFNAGVMVVEPNAVTFQDMMSKIHILTSHDGGDTGFLNSYYSDWYTWDSAHRLSFSYNAQRTMHWLTYKGNPGYWKSINPISILHYSSNPKPWSPEGQQKKGELEMIWWHYFLESKLGLGMHLEGCPFFNTVSGEHNLMKEESKGCTNEKCKCQACTCGDGCTCGISMEVTCDPCREFKEKKMAEMAKKE